MKHVFKTLIVLMAVAGIGASLYMLRAEPEAAAAPEMTAPAAAAVTAPEGVPAVVPAAAEAAPTPDIPAFASEQERLDTQAARREALPDVLATAERSIAQLQEEIDTLRRSGALASEITAREEKIRALQALRVKVLARNADIVAPN